MKCDACQKETNVSFYSDGKNLCSECDDEYQKNKILERAVDVKEARDFKEWDGSDLSDLFWYTFIEYKKNPTLHGIETINRIFLWSCHANHTLSSTIYHTLKWCGMDLFKERDKMREMEGIK